MIWSDSFVPYGEGQKAPVGGLTDVALLEKLRQYKRQIAKRYRVLDSAQMERLLPKGDLWISPKLDGELWFLVRQEGELALCAHNGRVLRNIPLLRSLAGRLAAAPDFLVAGELVAPIAEGRPRSYHVATALADDQFAAHLAFHPFDLVTQAGVDVAGTPYGQRLASLQAWFGAEGTMATLVGDAAVAVSQYREWVGAGKHEGMVVRSEQNVNYKIKPHLTLDAVVVAYGVRLVGEIRQLRELSLALVRDDGRFQLLGTVGNGFSEEDRIGWLARLEALETSSAFRMANSEGTLSRFVRPEQVVECRCSDLLVSDSDDRQIRRMCLAWTPQEGYRPMGEWPTAAMLHPVFLRERGDKRVDAGDVGITQITSRVSFEDERVSLSSHQASKAVVRARKVWTKETKGLVAVRKYVLIETDQAANDYPPFVLFSTDYSPGRAEPLQTTLRTADTLSTAERQIAAWMADNIKKGWNPVAAG
ncbi:DNA ligase (ATP) [Gammaproteobacteria bacterium]